MSLLDAALELDQLIASETVRARYIRLVRIRELVQLALPGDGDRGGVHDGDGDLGD